MNTTFKSSQLAVILFISVSATAQKAEEVSYNPNLVMDTTKKSIKSRGIGVIHNDSVKINYYSPGVRSRVIWGGLVPYNKVWVTGAHDATNIEIGKPFIVGGKEIPAGKYALFSIPTEKKWTIIINKNWQQHLASKYDEKDDMVRFKVKPRKNRHTERLQYFIDDTKVNKGMIAMEWEKIRIKVPFAIKN